jgi:phospholipid/cholesterol/gamma-HCH transport system permease protein
MIGGESRKRRDDSPRRPLAAGRAIQEDAGVKADAPHGTWHAELDGDRTLELELRGRPDPEEAASVWRAVLAAQRRQPRSVVVDAAGLGSLDASTLALLLELRRNELSGGPPLEIRGLAPELREELERHPPPAEPGPEAAAVRPRRAVERLGRAAAAVVREGRAQVAFAGELAAGFAHALRRPRTLRLRDALVAAERAGANALPITLLIGFLIGVILAYQSAQPLRRFAAEVYAADLVAISMVRELGPLLTAVLLAGRTGSAFAAEIGTMKVDEELDALSTMGLDPVRFLVLTRVLAAVAMAPLLTLFFELAGLIGGALVLRTFGITFALFASEVVEWVDLSDLLGGLFKSLVFGALIGAVGCLRGLQTGIGADAVGRSATSAVVSGIVLIVAADGVFSVLYHELGI